MPLLLEQGLMLTARDYVDRAFHAFRTARALPAEQSGEMIDIGMEYLMLAGRAAIRDAEKHVAPQSAKTGMGLDHEEVGKHVAGLKHG
jgi:hypothetical protein